MCPDQATLLLYLDEELPSTQMEALTAHVDGCQQCQQALDNVLVANSQANIVDRIRAVASSVLTESPDEGDGEAASDSDSNPPTQMLGSGQIAMVPRFAVRPSAIPGYDIQGEIGRGGMGVVYRAVHRRLGRTVALKMILGGGMIDPRIVQRFLFEAEILARVRHPQIVQVYEMSITSGRDEASPDVPYIAMELLEGGTLVKAMQGKRWAPRDAATLIEGLARALHAIHTQGIIHRDIKPANILATEAGVYKLTDFGLAKASDQHDSNLTATGVIMGTPNYMSPEQAAGSKFIGPSTDVYALGAILFELLAGRPPFEGGEPLALLMRVVQETPSNVRSIRGDVPVDLAAITMKCLNKEPERRYSSADALANDLERFLTNRPTRAKSVGTLGRLRYWAKRNPAMATVLSTLAVVLVTAFVCVFLFWRNAVYQASNLKEALGRADFLTNVANDNAIKANQLRAERTATNAELAFDVAVARCERGDILEGIEQFFQALRLARESNNPELERVTRANIVAWSSEYQKLEQEIDTTGLGIVRGVVPNADGTILGIYTDDRIRIYDLNRKKILSEFTPEFPRWSFEWFVNRIPIISNFVRTSSSFHCVAISPDNAHVVMGTPAGVIFCYKLNGQFEKIIRVRHRTYFFPDIWGVKFTGNNQVWVCGTAGLLQLYDLNSGMQINNIPLVDPDPGTASQQPERTSVMALDVSPDGKTVVMGDRLGRIQEWNVERGKPPRLQRSRSMSGWVNSVAYSSSGRYLAATGTWSRASVWDRQRVDDLPKLDVSIHGNYGIQLSFSCDDHSVAVTENDAVQLWDLQAGVPQGRKIYGSFGKFLPTQYKVLVSRKDEVAVHVVPVVPQAAKIGTLPGQIRDMAFSPDGRQLAVIKNGVYLFERGQLEKSVKLDNYDYVDARTVRYADQQSHLVVGLSRMWIALNLKTGDAYPHLTNYNVHFSIAVDPNGERIWARSQHFLECWTSDGKTQLAMREVIPRNTDLRESIGFVHVPQRSEIVLWCGSKIFIIPDDLTKKETRTIQTPSTIRKLVVSAKGEWILTGQRDGTLLLVDYTTGEPVHHRRMSHTQDVSSVAFSPDETKLVSGSRDGTVQVWDRVTALPFGPRKHTASAVLSLAASPAHAEFAIGTSDGVVQYSKFVDWKTDIPVEDLESWFETLKR